MCCGVTGHPCGIKRVKASMIIAPRCVSTASSSALPDDGQRILSDSSPLWLSARKMEKQAGTGNPRFLKGRNIFKEQLVPLPDSYSAQKSCF